MSLFVIFRLAFVIAVTSLPIALCRPALARELPGYHVPPPFKGALIPRVRLRKGLAVIADFADTELEDWQGEGINNTEELSQQLKQMEEHWAWLSRGRELFEWDIIRITLPVNLTPDAYPGWIEYRNAVGALIRQQVDVSQYDANRDGIIDTAWIIASNNGRPYNYMIGGTSSNAGVNMFVDGQNSVSIVAGATGNFNHETGHTLGLPDLYGSYGTLAYLTVMSDSWPVPPQDFTAYERTLLRWERPRRIAPGRHHIHLAPADQQMDAVRISTARPTEYFLIEYRHRPDSGFGSIAPPYDGLAVYHVFDGSNENTDPPLLKLEPADGAIMPGTAPALDDFLYPENYRMQMPLVLRSYYGGQEVFRIEHVQRATDGGMTFDVNVKPRVFKHPTNLLNNPGFEQGTPPYPTSWQPDAFDPSAQFAWTKGQWGGHRVSITALTPNDARWVQTVTNLAPGGHYELCGWLKGENITTTPNAQTGANISLMGGFTMSPSFSGTFKWRRTCLRFQAETSNVTVACRLGFYSSTLTGTLWCDNMSLTPLNSAFFTQ